MKCPNCGDEMTAVCMSADYEECSLCKLGGPADTLSKLHELRAEVEALRATVARAKETRDQFDARSRKDAVYSIDERSVYEAVVEELDEALKGGAIHMPRWASRLTLEVTGVRVERGDNGWEWVIEFKRVEVSNG